MNAPLCTLDAAMPRGRTSTQATPWQQKAIIAYPLLLALAILLVLRLGLGPTGVHDSLSIYWVWADQFTPALAHGNLYPRWMPESDAGLGTPVFYYYPPVAFYLTGAFGILGLSTYASLIATFGAAFAASGIGCWHWLEGRSNHPLLAAAFFVAAPYHLFNYTERGALAESVATALIPPIAIGMRRIAEGRGGIVVVAIAYALMICTHLPLALLVSLFLVAPYAIVHRHRLIAFGGAVAGGIGLAAIYLLPALALAPYHDAAKLYRAPNLRTEYWSLLNGNWVDVTFSAIFLIIGALFAAALVLSLFRRDRWAMLALGLTIVVSGLVPLVWSLPLLRDVQFPYRALPIAEFALATALARCCLRQPRAIAATALPLAASLIVLPGFNSRQVRDLARLEAVHPDAYEYLPKGVLAPGQEQAKLGDVLAARVPPPHVSGMVVEPVFYFPAWSCAVPEPKTTLIMHRPDCHPRLVWTAPERIGAAVSAAFALVFLAFGLTTRRRKSLAA